MGVEFSGSGQYLAAASYEQPAYPFTIACWIRTNQVTAYKVAVGLSDAVNSEFSIGMAGNIGGDPLYVLARNISSVASFGGTVGVSTWVSAIGVFRSTTNREGYLNGVSVGVATTSIAPSTTDLRIGGTSRAGSNDWNGSIAECAIYGADVLPELIDGIAAGRSPLRTAPSALLDYWPMRSIQGLQSVAGRHTRLTVAGAPLTIDHPDIERLPRPASPRRRLYLIPKAAAAGVSLTPASVSHAHALDALPWIAQVHQLAPPDVAHAHALDATTVSEAPTLAAADVAHGHALDAATVVQTHTLTVADVAHAQALDAGVLVQTHTLTTADAGHGHALDATTVSQDAQLLPADVAHGQALDAPAVTQTHQLTPGDVGHAQALDAAVLTVTHILQAAGIDHAHALDATTATPTQLLVAADIAHAHALEAPGVTQTHVIVVSDVLHAHLLDAATVTGGVEVLVTPLGSVIYVHADPAVIVVAADPTTIIVH